jgi:arylsulfatase A-like enzyme
LSWVKKHKKKAFFAYLHYMDIHAPYDAPVEFSKIFGLKSDIPLSPGNFETLDIRILNEIGLSSEEKNQIINLYDGAIKYFDNNFEKIVKNLKELGIFERTIIILTSDHGEEFWEHQGFAHGHTLYNELLHVPLIIGHPSALKPKRINSYVELIDLFPTILDMTGIENDFEMRGTNLIPPKARNKNSNKEIFFEALLDGAEKKGILKDGWKLIENTGKKNIDTFHYLGDITKYLYPEFEKSLELYKIDQDFSEKRNLIDVCPQIAARLKTYLELFKSASFGYRKHEKAGIEKKLKELKSLGYVK